MHIIEGFLPWQWSLTWYIISIPVVTYGIFKIKKITDEKPESKPLLAVSGAFIFVLSSLKLLSVTGSSSHPTGTGLGGVLFGPAVTSVLGTIALIFQALLLTHGGITTLGANIFSMSIVGPLAAWLTYKSIQKVGLSPSIGIFLAAFAGDLLTYVTTSFQIALAFPSPTFQAALTNFMGIFAITQIPFATAEGLLTVIIFEYLIKLRPDILENLKVIEPKIREASRRDGLNG